MGGMTRYDNRRQRVRGESQDKYVFEEGGGDIIASVRVEYVAFEGPSSGRDTFFLS